MKLLPSFMITFCMQKAKISQGNYTQSVPRCYVAPKECFYLMGSQREFQGEQHNNEPAQRTVITPGPLWSIYAFWE